MSGLHGAIFLIILGFNNAFNIRSFDNDNLSLDETEEKRIDDQNEVTANSASWMAQIQFPGIDGLGISHYYCQGVLYQKMFILTSTNQGEKSVDTKCLSEKGAPICKFVPNSFGCHDCELLGIVTSGKGCSNYISGSRLAIDIFGFKNWIDEKIAKYQNNNKTACENSGETEDKGEVDDVDEEPKVDKL